MREAGAILVRRWQPDIPETDAHALIGQLNLGTRQFGRAAKTRLEREYCRWVPDVILDHLRPSYVILVGLASILVTSNSFDPAKRLAIDWQKPDEVIPFLGYTKKQFRFSVWRRLRPDGKRILFVLWPQHPSRAPMTNREVWRQSFHEFAASQV